jgi:hypothetical protein
MSLDERIPVKSCMFGCHSELDRLTKREPFECGFETRETEKACIGCIRCIPNDEHKGSDNEQQ